MSLEKKSNSPDTAKLLKKIRILEEEIENTRDLAQFREQYQVLMEILHAGVVVHSSDTSVIFSNPAAQRLLHLSEEELKGVKAIDTSWKFIYEDGKTMDLIDYPVNQVMENKLPLTNYTIGVIRDGPSEPNWLLCNAHPIIENPPKIEYIIVTFIDISREKKLNDEIQEKNKILEFQATHDSLTNLWNHKTIFNLLEQESKRSKRYGTNLSIAMLDIDHFKSINDRFGHQKGDEVLEKISSIILGNIRDTDFAGRYGGEEFLIIFPDSDLNSCEHALQRIRNDISDNICIYDHTVTVSVGLTAYKNRESTLAFIERADQLLYKAKKNGRNAVITEL